MNEIATTGERSLTPAKAGMSSMHIAKLFASMMSPKGEEYAKAVASDYVEAVKGLPEWAVAETSEAYRYGRIGDGRFVPTPGEFAKHARSLFEEEARRVQDRRSREQQAEELRQRKAMLIERTPEEKARVRQMCEETKAKIKAAMVDDYNTADRVALRADMMARHDARFLPEKEASEQ